LRAKSTASASSVVPPGAVDGGDRYPLTENLAGWGERVAAAVLDEFGDPVVRQLHHQTAGLVVE